VSNSVAVQLSVSSVGITSFKACPYPSSGCGEALKRVSGSHGNGSEQAAGAGEFIMLAKNLKSLGRVANSL
jgi:hypothetical protein